MFALSDQGILHDQAKPMKKSRVILAIALVLVAIANTTTTWVDRTPYHQMDFYQRMMERLDSLSNNLTSGESDSLYVGWSKVSLTPPNRQPLAGYGARDPMTLSGIHDSVFVRTVILTNKNNTVAMVSTELLINHPELINRVTEILTTRSDAIPSGNIFYTATHTHSSVGAWAPGVVGKLFAGDYLDSVVTWLAQRVVQSIEEAEKNVEKAGIAFGELSVPDGVRNRVAKEKGDIDPWFKVILIEREMTDGVLASYAAHATCLSHRWTEVSGDFPGVFCRKVKADFTSFSAGAVGSMSPPGGKRGYEKAENLGESLAEQVHLLKSLNPEYTYKTGIQASKVKLELREPAIKLSTNLTLRPWLVKNALGEYESYVSVVKIGSTLFIGLPCDFSGELALPLYSYARNKDTNLVITSFNGGYIGYVPDDRWYDLDTYETRTMSWYGFDNGAYFTEVVKRIIDTYSP